MIRDLIPLILGGVELVVLLAELFDIFWTPPDVSNFIASLLPDFHLQGPEDLARDLIPLILGALAWLLASLETKSQRS